MVQYQAKNKMNNNHSVVAATSAMSSVDWNKPNLQKIVDAVSKGTFGPWLTQLLVEEAWNQGKFVVENNFKLKKGGGICSYFGGNFLNLFHNEVEEMVTGTGLASFTLPEDMLDKDIITKIDGVEKAISSLGEMFAMMEKQPDGPKSSKGPLLTNGNANIIYKPQSVNKIDDHNFSYILGGKEVFEKVEDSQYLFKIRDQWFVLRAVGVYWDGDGWRVVASSVESPFRWDAGSQAFSRKPLETQATQKS